MYLQFRPLTGPDGPGARRRTRRATRTGSSRLRSRSSTTQGTRSAGLRLRVTSSARTGTTCVSIWSTAGGVGNDQFSRVRRFDGNAADHLDGKHFRIDVTGTYTNNSLNVADAEYTSLDNWAAHQQGYDVDPSFSEKASGMCRSTVTSWTGAPYSASHAYGLSTTLPGSVNLTVFDGDSNANTKDLRLVSGQQRLAELHDHLPRSVALSASPRSDPTPHHNSTPRLYARRGS